MIVHVYERVAQSSAVSGVFVATDDERIAEAVRAYGGRAVMTRTTHTSGSDRIAEAAATLDADIVVNVQGDEPFVEPDMIDEAVAPLLADGGIEMATLCRPIEREADYRDRNVVKVVVGLDGMALYFSRAPIPCFRDGTEGGGLVRARRHVGLYVYRRETLLRFASLAPTPLERAEALEQLRALEHGIRIKVVDTSFDSIGVDTFEDLVRARQRLADGSR